MKKTIWTIIAAVALTLSACNSSDKQTAAEETTPATEETTAAPEATEGKVVELTDPASLAPGTEVKQLTVVDFNAIWCGPCRQLAPVLEEMAAKYAGKVTFVSVDVDKYGELMDSYNLGQSIPVVLFLKPDGTKEHYVGTSELLPADKFEALIEKNL